MSGLAETLYPTYFPCSGRVRRSFFRYWVHAKKPPGVACQHEFPVEAGIDNNEDTVQRPIDAKEHFKHVFGWTNVDVRSAQRHALPKERVD